MSEKLPVITTNTVEPIQPLYPEAGKRQSARGPIITTGNVEEIRARVVAETRTDEAKPSGRGRPKKA